MSDKTIRIPVDTYTLMRQAIRLAARDSRHDDRVLHDSTRQALEVANDAIEDFQDSRGPIR